MLQEFVYILRRYVMKTYLDSVKSRGQRIAIVTVFN
jgi:hypothetical protein